MEAIAPRDLAALEVQVRAARGDVVVMIDATLAPVALATLRAAIGPLAVERAPDARINAIVADVRVHPDDLASARSWLATARSTTGQVLELSPRE